MPRNIMETFPQEVTILKGGGNILKGTRADGKTKTGQTWIARAIYWGPEEPMLWVLDPTNEGRGAWVAFEDVASSMLGRRIEFI